MRRRRLQGLHDPVVMIAGVGLKVGIPNRYLAEHDLAIDQGCDLAVTAAEVESNPAAFEMPSQRRGALPFRRQVLRVDNLEWMVEHFLGDDVRIESSGRRIPIILGQLLRENFRPIKMDSETAARPKQKFHSPLDAKEVCRGC